MSGGGDVEDVQDYHSLNDDDNKAIIQQLIEECEDEEITAVLRCYVIGKPPKDIRKQLKNNHNLGPLAKAAAFLKITTTNLKKEELITSIIRRMETLLKDLCGVCGEYYNNTLHDEPYFSCLICNQGCHQPCFEAVKTVMENMTENLRHSFPFVCTKCFGDFSDDHSAAPKAMKSPVKANPKDTVILGAEITHEEVTVGDPEDADESQVVTEDQVGEGDTPTNVKICPRYKWGRCPEYDTCEFRHPPRCWKWLEHGKCSYKSKCKFHHPPLCHDSLNNKQCFNGECRFFHLKRTLRYKMDDEHLKDSLQSSNYHAQIHQPHLSYQNRLQPQAVAFQPPTPQTFHAHPSNTQHQPRPVQQMQNPSSINRSDMSFLLQTIKGIKDELGKEIAELKGNLQARTRTEDKPQVITSNTVPQTLTTPNLYNMPNLMVPMQPQALHPHY